MSCHKLARHEVLPSHFVPSSPPAVIPCAPIECATKPWPIAMLWAFDLPSSTPPASHLPTALLLSSLSSALSVFPVLCASLHEAPDASVDLHLDSSNPVLLTDASHPSPLSSHIPPPSIRYAPPNPPPPSPTRTWSTARASPPTCAPPSAPTGAAPPAPCRSPASPAAASSSASLPSTA